MSQNLKYKAFISYSHDDIKIAKWIHQSLERYKISRELHKTYPSLPESLYPIFRDKDELSINSSLDKVLSEALRDSEYLIVICSTSSANSKWVNKEITTFEEMHGEENIILIIINGTPNADKQIGVEDVLECIPINIKKINKFNNSEFLAADIRKNKDGKRIAILKVVSALLSISYNDLNQRDERRRRSNLIAYLSISALISFFMVGLSFYSFMAKEESTKLLYANIKNKGYLYKDNLKNPIKSNLSFSSAIINSPGAKKQDEAEILYTSTLNPIELVDIIEESAENFNIVFNRSKTKYITYDNSGVIKLYDTTNKTKKDITNHSGLVLGAVFNRVGTEILSWGEDGAVKIWNIKSSEEKTIQKYSTPISKASYDKNDENVISWEASRYFRRGEPLVKLWIRKQSKNISFRHKGLVYGAAASSDGSRVISWADNGTVMLWSEKENKESIVISHSIEGDFKARVPIIISQINKSNILAVAQDCTFIEWNGVEIKRKICNGHLKKSYIINHGEKILTLSDNHNRKELNIWDSIKKTNSLIFIGDIIDFSINESTGKIVVWEGNGTISLYSISDNESKVIEKEGDGVFRVKITNSDIVILYKNGIVKIINLNSLKITSFLHGPELINASFFDKKIISWSSNGLIKKWNIEKDNQLTTEENSSLRDTVIDSLEKIMITGDLNGNINIYDYDSKNLTFSFQLVFEDTDGEQYPISVDGVSLSKDHETLTAWGGFDLIDWGMRRIDEENTRVGRLSILEVKSKSWSHRTYRVPVKTAILSKNKDKVLVLLGDTMNKEGVLVLYDRENDDDSVISSDDHSIKGATFNNKENSILSWSYDGSIKIWDINSKTHSTIAKHKSQPNGAMYINSEKSVISWGTDHEILLWSAASKESRVLTQHQSEVIGIQVDNNRIFSWSSDGEVKVYNLKTRKSKRLAKHDTAVRGVKLNKSGNKLLSWSSPSYINSQGAIVNDFLRKNSAGEFQLSDINGIKIFSQKNDSGFNGAVFGTDDTRVLSWDGNGEVILWDIEDHKKLLSIKHKGFIRGAQFTQNKGSILSWSNDGTIKSTLIRRDLKVDKDFYLLESQVRNGAYLTDLDVLEPLKNQDWRTKKRYYESLLNR